MVRDAFIQRHIDKVTGGEERTWRQAGLRRALPASRLESFEFRSKWDSLLATGFPVVVSQDYDRAQLSLRTLSEPDERG